MAPRVSRSSKETIDQSNNTDFIPRDRHRPTYAYCWDQEASKPTENELSRIFILVDTYINDNYNSPKMSAIVVQKDYEDTYKDGLYYETEIFDNFEIIKEPTYRAFNSPKELLDHLLQTKRTDWRYCYLDEKGEPVVIHSISAIDDKEICNNWGPINLEKVFEDNAVWFNDRTRMAIKE